MLQIIFTPCLSARLAVGSRASSLSFRTTPVVQHRPGHAQVAAFVCTFVIHRFSSDLFLFMYPLPLSTRLHLLYHLPIFCGIPFPYPYPFLLSSYSLSRFFLFFLPWPIEYPSFFSSKDFIAFEEPEIEVKHCWLLSWKFVLTRVSDG